jgi:hypothetical protein
VAKYKFIKPFTATISGGITGSLPKSFKVGDVVYGKTSSGNINIITASVTENPVVINGADIPSPYFDVPVQYLVAADTSTSGCSLCSQQSNWWKNLSGISKGALIVAAGLIAWYGYKKFIK